MDQLIVFYRSLSDDLAQLRWGESDAFVVSGVETTDPDLNARIVKLRGALVDAQVTAVFLADYLKEKKSEVPPS